MSGILNTFTVGWTNFETPFLPKILIMCQYPISDLAVPLAEIFFTSFSVSTPHLRFGCTPNKVLNTFRVGWTNFQTPFWPKFFIIC